MIDAVLGYHINPATCGVAKFNHRLAQELGVPCEPLERAYRFRHPLISIKTSELDMDWALDLPAHGDLLLHDRPSRVPSRPHIFYADELGCPATIRGNPTRGAYRVLVFGMAHKLALPHFERLKTQLDAEHPDYTIELSTAVHEGSPWDLGLAESVASMRAIFGDHLRVLGFLGDDALAKELQDCDAVAAFFTPALRANNTSAWAAIEAGKRLYTNLDDHSPSLDTPPTWARLVDILTASSSNRVDDSLTVSTNTI